MVYIEIDGFIYNEIDKLDVAAWSVISVKNRMHKNPTTIGRYRALAR